MHVKCLHPSRLSAPIRCMHAVCCGFDLISCFLQYLHSLGIVHGDLKPANVLLKSTSSDSRGFSCKQVPDQPACDYVDLRANVLLLC